MVNINTIIAVSYATIQITIAIFVSIYGAVHVRQCRRELQNGEKNNENNNDQSTIEMQTVNAQSIEIQKKTDVGQSSKREKGFCEEWVKTIWKMRSVYSALAVHSFDVLTDILVIMEWMGTANIPGDHIDPQLMAYCGIGVVIFSKVVSSIAIFIKERDCLRSFLQLFDLLIFLEIYESHKKLKRKFKAKDNKEGIESTLSFKYLRNMEATFESIPQSILQLVYVMRIPSSTIQPVFAISIIQSVISMTNSVLNHDGTQMQDEKFKKYKQRLPPSLPFLGHALSRFSEIVYRIGLLSLVWTVCGGFVFSIVLGIEFLFVATRTVFACRWESTFNIDTILLAISFFIVIPAEDVYANSEATYYFAASCNLCFFALCISCVNVIGYITLILLFYKSGVEFNPTGFENLNGHIPFTRLNVSLGEIVVVVAYAFFGEDGTRKDFLFSYNHGLAVFIATCAFYFIYGLFPVMFPDFSLPFNVNVRSKWGYAYANEIEELMKIKVPKKFKVRKWNRHRKKYQFVQSTDPADFWDETCLILEYDTRNKDQYGDSRKRDCFGQEISAAIFALMQGNNEIVEWLETQGAKTHKNVTLNQIKKWFRPES